MPAAESSDEGNRRQRGSVSCALFLFFCLPGSFLATVARWLQTQQGSQITRTPLQPSFNRYAEISPDNITSEKSSPRNRGQVTYSPWTPLEARAGAGEQDGPRNTGNLEELYSVPKKSTNGAYANVKIPPKAARTPQPVPPLEDAESSDSDHDEGHGGPRMRTPTAAIVDQPLYQNFVPGQRQPQLPPKSSGGGGDGPDLPARSPSKDRNRPRSNYENVGQARS